MDPCVTCKNEVEVDHKAMECDLCEQWEHVMCVKECDRPSEDLYDALVRCRGSKAIQYVCSRCRKKGSVTRRMLEKDLELSRVSNELARATDERLASARQLESKGNELRELRAELDRVKGEKKLLSDRVKSLTKELKDRMTVTSESRIVTVKMEASSEPLTEQDDGSGASSQDDGSSSDEESRHTDTNIENRRQLHPPGFKEMRSRVQPFSGKRGEDDFQLWLEDFEEASADCQWSDQERARWFSWFITGPAKATWQRTLKVDDKSSWGRIVEVYKGQYGIHLDPRTAYQRCHELSYDQFGSAQGLLDAMRDYQRMAPQKLSDETLESILWNKVPIELQREVKEITDGSVQELLQRLLRAESVLAERKRRSQCSDAAPKTASNGQGRAPGPIIRPVMRDPSKPARRNASPSQGAEMSSKGIECFNCHRKGHIAKQCPNGGSKPRTPIRALSTATDESDTTPKSDKTTNETMWKWTRVLSTSGSEHQDGSSEFPIVGPTYKVDVTVDGIKTRALLDHGSQVTIVRQQLLPMVREQQQWSMETCMNKVVPLKSQPVGASGQELGAHGMAVLNILMEATGKIHPIPCYVLDSNQPLWSGELEDCGVLMGTNALVKYGFTVTHSNGTKVEPKPKDAVVEGTTTVKTINVVLKETVHLKPHQTKVTKSGLEEGGEAKAGVFMVSPNEEMLAEKHCDVLETVSEGDPTKVTLSNWGNCPIVMKKGSKIGILEEVTRVGKDDDIWTDTTEVVRLCQTAKATEGRRQELCNRLQIGDACGENGRSQLENLLLQYHDVFALVDEELGETDVVSHAIDTGTSPPVQSTPRRLPYALRKELEEEMDTLLRTGCIEPSTSPYSSPLVLVRKKSGGLRVCVDYRALNQNTVADRYPIPRVDELVDMVGKQHARVFSSLDLMKGYHQVQMEENSKLKTAFTCHLGLYQYRRMPFGLTNAPATFQRLMAKLFGGRDWDFVFVYLDDILVASKTIEEHLEHLQKVVKRLREAKLRLKPEKCVFATNQVEYLGHTLTADGVRPNEKNVQAVVDFPRPNCAKEVRGFLGMANFYRRHVQGMASICRPLTELTRKDKESGKPVPFVWTDDCQRAFEKVKKSLVSAPLLHPPDWEKEFFLWTDASLAGFGAVLEQEITEGMRVPIAYASRTTSTAEKKYGVTELEVAALVYALEHFEVYLLGNAVTVYTDHKALVQSYIPYLKSQPKGLLARWYLRLARFLPTLKMEHKPGSANVVADALSRAPVNETVKCNPEEVLLITHADDPALPKVQQEQRRDSDLLQLIEFLEAKKLPENPQEAKRVTTQAKKGYYLVDGILYYEGSDMPERRRLVVPKHLREKVMEEHHASPFSGHFAAKKMTKRVSQYFFWAGMRGDIHRKCMSCVTCASVQGQGNPGKPPLKSIEVGGIFECIGMDFLEMDTAKSGNKYALVFQDYLSKWPEVYPVRDRKAETVAQCLLDLVWKHGVPSRVIHDRAAEFMSDVLQETAQLIGLAQLPTSGGHPQTDGLVERFNRTLKQMLAKVVGQKGRDWDELLGPVLLAYRTTPHSSTGEAPFYLVYGRDANLPTALDFKTPAVKYPIVATDYGKELSLELKRARQAAKVNIQRAQKDQKKYYDQNCKNCELKVGDLVMLKVQSRFKLDRSYKGPFTIQSLTATNAVIRLANDDSAEPWNVSRQRLSKCHPGMEQVKPWIGHANKLRRRRRIRRPNVLKERTSGATSGTATQMPETTTTRSGRTVKRPPRYLCVDSSKVLSGKEGEVVRINKEDHETVTCEGQA